jgi:hypothetical protein
MNGIVLSWNSWGRLRGFIYASMRLDHYLFQLHPPLALSPSIA